MTHLLRGWEIATETASGLSFYDFKISDGAPVQPGQGVTIHYTVTDNSALVEDGPWLENSWDTQDPLVIKIGQGVLLKGLEEGLRGMRIAGQRIMKIPPDLAFGTRGVPNRIPADTTLYFDVYIVSAVPA